jgi:antitoxin PrlF
MPAAHSKLTAQGQISVPADVRRELGIGPGSVLEWRVRNGRATVTKVGRNSSVDVHAALFGGEKPNESIDVKQAIGTWIRKRHAVG